MAPILWSSLSNLSIPYLTYSPLNKIFLQSSCFSLSSATFLLIPFSFLHSWSSSAILVHLFAFILENLFISFPMFHVSFYQRLSSALWSYLFLIYLEWKSYINTMLNSNMLAPIWVSLLSFLLYYFCLIFLYYY